MGENVVGIVTSVLCSNTFFYEFVDPQNKRDFYIKKNLNESLKTALGHKENSIFPNDPKEEKKNNCLAIYKYRVFVYIPKCALL